MAHRGLEPGGRGLMPLRRPTIALTRPPHLITATARSIAERGATPYLLPTLRIRPLENMRGVRRLLSEMERGRVDFIVFMSVNGLDHFCRLLRRAGGQPQLVSSRARVIAVGPATAEAARRNGIRVWRIPRQFTSRGVVRLLSRHAREGQVVYLVRARNSPRHLNHMLRRIGLRVHQLSVYTVTAPRAGGRVKQFLEALEGGKIDAIIFGSPSSVRNLFQLLPTAEERGRAVRALNEHVTTVALGPVTARAMRRLGLKVTLMPKRYTYSAALDLLEAHWGGRQAESGGSPCRRPES